MKHHFMPSEFVPMSHHYLARTKIFILGNEDTQMHFMITVPFKDPELISGLHYSS